MDELLKVACADNDVRYVPGGDKRFCSVAHESRYKWMVDTFDLKGKRVLDFGCGSGYGAYMLAQAGVLVDAIDYSGVAIEYAKKTYRHKDLCYYHADACDYEALHKILSRYDLVVSFDVLEHIEKYYLFIENANKLLSEDGVFVVGCPNRHMTLKWNSEWNPYHFQEFSPVQLRHVLSAYFKQVDVYGQDFSDAGKRLAAMMSNRTHPRLILNIGSFEVKINSKVQPKDYRSEDIVFTIEKPNNDINNCFGFVAVCRGRVTG
jgi:cyclopropane fatty-acyl-phospholipid synthase-like methyltransferase